MNIWAIITLKILHQEKINMKITSNATPFMASLAFTASIRAPPRPLVRDLCEALKHLHATCRIQMHKIFWWLTGWLGWWQSFMDLVLFRRFSNWWQLKHFVIFTPYILGVSWSQFDKNKSNHQLVIFRRCFFSTKKYTTPIWYANFPMGHFWYLTRSRGGTVFFWWNRWKKDVWHETLGKMCSAASMLRNREFRTLSSLNSMNPWS